MFTRLVEMCGIRGRRAPRRGPAGATAAAGENAAAGSSQRPVGPRAWALLLCTPLLFMFTEKEGERRERSLWLPSSDHKYCKLQMAAPLPNSAHTASPNAMEMRPERAPRPRSPRASPSYPARRGPEWGILHCTAPQAPSPPSPRPCRGTPEKGEGGAGFAPREPSFAGS